MLLRRSAIVCIAAAMMPAIACGPDFPPELLTDRAAALADLPAGQIDIEAARLVVPGDDLRAGRPRGWYMEPQRSDGFGLTDRQAAMVDALRASASPAEAAALARELADALPAEVRHYTLGAVAWHAGQLELAGQQFRAVLALPEAGRRLRGTWAAWMLGRLALRTNDHRAALDGFRQVRALRLAGAADPDDLALASWGEEGATHLARGDYASAVAAYAEQAARGDHAGADSLAVVVRRLLRDPAGLATHIADPLVQRVLAAYAWSRRGYGEGTYAGDGDGDGDGDDDDDDDAGSDRPTGDPRDSALAADATGPLSPAAALARIAGAVDAAGLATFAGADQLAAAAYAAGAYAMAARFLAVAQGPLAHWVDARLKLRAGNAAAAATALAAASQAFATDPGLDTRIDAGYWAVTAQCRMDAEAGILQLARGDYVAAAEQLFRAGPHFWQDFAHVAERVLTVDELAALTARLAPDAPDAGPDAPIVARERDDIWGQHPLDTAAALRALTARRLLRTRGDATALPLVDPPELLPVARAYVDALRDGGDDIDRAEALARAADIARRHGLQLLGFEGDPDGHFMDGAFDFNDPTTWNDLGERVHAPRRDRPLPDAWAGPDEAARQAASIAQPLQRFHYRHIAADLATRAAGLVPARSQAYAALMCRATSYVSIRTPEVAEGIYLRYLRNGPYVPWGDVFGTGDTFGSVCPEPDFAGARERRTAERFAAIGRVLRTWLPPVALVVLGIIAVRVMRRRRTGLTTGS